MQAGTLDSTREKCGVGISGDRRIRARVLARATSAGRPPSCLGSSQLISRNGTCFVSSGWRLGGAREGRLAGDGRMD